MVSRSTVVGALMIAELTILGLAASAIAVGPVGPAFGAPWRLPGEQLASAPFFERTFTAGVEPHVVIDVHDVPVSVEASNGTTVQITETRRTTGWVAGESSAISAQQTLDGVRIATSGEDIRHAVIGSYWREIRVVVPTAARLEIASAAQTTARGLRGTLIARIPVGKIDVSEQRGDVDVSTGEGRITMTDVQANQIAANSRNGRIYLTRVSADRINASSGYGRIVGVDIRAANGALTTNDGPIIMSFASNSDTSVNAHTAHGRIRAPGLRTRRGEDARSVVVLGEGQGRLDLSTAHGDITLTQGASV